MSSDVNDTTMRKFVHKVFREKSADEIGLLSVKTLRIQFLRFLGMENLGSDEKARFKKIVHEAFMSFYSNSEDLSTASEAVDNEDPSSMSVSPGKRQKTKSPVKHSLTPSPRSKEQEDTSKLRIKGKENCTPPDKGKTQQNYRTDRVEDEEEQEADGEHPRCKRVHQNGGKGEMRSLELGSSDEDEGKDGDDVGKRQEKLSAAERKRRKSGQIFESSDGEESADEHKNKDKVEKGEDPLAREKRKRNMMGATKSFSLELEDSSEDDNFGKSEVKEEESAKGEGLEENIRGGSAGAESSDGEDNTEKTGNKKGKLKQEKMPRSASPGSKSSDEDGYTHSHSKETQKEGAESTNVENRLCKRRPSSSDGGGGKTRKRKRSHKKKRSGSLDSENGDRHSMGNGYTKKHRSSDTDNSGAEVKDKSKSKNHKRTKSSDHEESSKLKNLKRYVRMCGLRKNYVRLFVDCKSMASKERKLEEVLRNEMSLEGRITLDKCKKAREAKEEAAELADLDKSNIITQAEGSRTRRSRSAAFTRTAKLPASPVPDDLQTFGRLKGIIDSEGSDDDSQARGVTRGATPSDDDEDNASNQRKKRKIESSSDESSDSKE